MVELLRQLIGSLSETVVAWDQFQQKEIGYFLYDGESPTASPSLKSSVAAVDKAFSNLKVHLRQLQNLEKELCQNIPQGVSYGASTTDSDSATASTFKNNLCSSAVATSMSSKSSVVDSIEPEGIHDRKEYQDFQALDPECDIRSVVSDAEDINSVCSTRRTFPERIAEEHLGVLLAQKQELKPQYEEAFNKMGKPRFIENFRRLLKRYYLDLSRQAETNLQRATTQLLRSRWARIRIAKQVAEIVRPDNKEAISQMERRILETERRVLDLEDWVSANPGLAIPIDPEIDDKGGFGEEGEEEHREMEGFEDEGTSDEEDGGQERENTKFVPNVSEMEAFLLEGDPFQNLTINLRLFLLPAASAPITRIIMTIPKDRIWFSGEDDYSFLNRAKLSVEHHTVDNWNWWPLQPPMHFLQKGQTRMHWQCVSLSFQ